MAGNINIRRDVTDPFYRYKMERLQSKIEGKGNGIKTVIPNLTSVAQSLARPPSYIIKYFGFELGAQTNTNPNDDRWIINGAHESVKLQDYLDGFINKFVLCKKCKNPETDVHIKDGLITLDCKACGKISDVDIRLKLSGFILKNEPKKGKKDKSTKKAERRAKKEARANGHANGDDEDDDDEGSQQNGNSPGDSDEANGVEDDGELAAGSDDEFTKQIQEGAKDIVAEPKEVEWKTDISEAAIQARAKELPGDLKRALVVNGDEEAEDGEGEGGAVTAYDQLGTWIQSQAEEKGGVAKVEDVEVYKKALELGIESKHRTLTVLAQTLFDKAMVKQIEKRAGMLKKMVGGQEKHEKALLGGTERFVTMEKPENAGSVSLMKQIPLILIAYYENDIVSEETLRTWCGKPSSKYVEKAESKKVRNEAKAFVEWLDNAEEDDSDDE